MTGSDFGEQPPDEASATPPAYQPPDYPPAYPPYPQPAGYGGAGYPPAPPEYGYPQPYPGGYGYPQPPATNTLAIVSLIASLTGLLCCIGSIVGVVTGAVALNQIKHTRQEGYGLAVAGIVVGVATLLVGLIVMIFALR